MRRHAAQVILGMIMVLAVAPGAAWAAPDHVDLQVSATVRGEQVARELVRGVEGVALTPERAVVTYHLPDATKRDRLAVEYGGLVDGLRDRRARETAASPLLQLLLLAAIVRYLTGMVTRLSAPRPVKVREDRWQVGGR